MVTHASLRKESNNKDGLPPSGRPVLPPAPLLRSGAGWTCQLFKRSNSCWETDPFYWLCSANTPPQSCQRTPWAREGLDPGGKGAASLGSGAQERPPLQGTGGLFLSFFFFCNFPHPVHPNPPQSRVQSLLGDAGAGPTWRSGDSPARVVAAAGRQVREGEAGAARRATRELGVAKGLGLWGDGGRWPRLNLCGAACRAATPSAPARATPWAQGASRDRASWAVGVGRAHPAPRGSAPPLASALGAGARGLPPGRGAPGPDADRKRPRPSRAAVWAGRGRVGGAQLCALGLHPGVFSSAESLGVGLSCWVRGVQVPPTAGP